MHTSGGGIVAPAKGVGGQRAACRDGKDAGREHNLACLDHFAAKALCADEKEIVEKRDF
jgi:hypothetical protein